MIGDSVKFKNIVIACSVEGHRAEYVSLMESMFSLTPFFVDLRGIRVILGVAFANKVLFSSIDDDVLGFMLICFLRSSIRKKTVGLFLRPLSCFDVGTRNFAKYTLFKFLKALPGVSIFSIIPHAFDKRIAKVTNYWVHDPQMWDKFSNIFKFKSELSRELLTLAGDRKIICYLGRISKEKGVDILGDLISNDKRLSQKFFVVVLGKPATDSEDILSVLESSGAYVLPRLLTSDEMSSVYDVSTIVWACYAPNYNQASGVFGRAIQKGILTVVRKGALISKYSNYDSLKILVFDPNDKKSFCNALLMEPVLTNQIYKKDLFENWRFAFQRKILASL